MNGYHLITVNLILTKLLQVVNAYYKLYDFDSNQALLILNEHNRLRGLEPASNMQKLVWDWNLASLAKDWASRCAAMHRPFAERSDRFGYDIVGENIWWSSEQFLRQDLASVIKDFYDEKPFYSFSYTWCQPGEMCGHYTQVVWATSCSVGCAAAYCDTIFNGRGISSGHMIVCNYGPAGNYQGQQPYVYGTQCASCPGSCQGGLCPSSCAATPLGFQQAAPLAGTTAFPKPVPPPPELLQKEPVKTEIISSSGGCVDGHANCPQWSAAGECQRNAIFMNTFCKVSCKIGCSQPTSPVAQPVASSSTAQNAILCTNKESLCPFWANIGECTKNTAWMNSHCYSACHKTECPDESPMLISSGCLDNDWQCSFWASIGECDKNAYYMKWKCPKSCSKC